MVPKTAVLLVLPPMAPPAWMLWVRGKRLGVLDNITVGKKYVHIRDIE